MLQLSSIQSLLMSASTLPMVYQPLASSAARTTVNATITKLIQGDLVIGLVVSSKSQPDPICEACLAGKMTSGPFPSSDSISEHPLELVHSDLHGPLSCCHSLKDIATLDDLY